MTLVCETCKKDSDIVKIHMFVGDKRKIDPPLGAAPHKCKRCSREFYESEKMYVVEKG